MARGDVTVAIAMIVYIAIFAALTVVSDENPAVVFLGTCPILLFLITVYYFKQFADTFWLVFWLLPLLYPVAFYMIYRSDSLVVLSQMDGGILTVFNILVCYILNVILMINVRPKKEGIQKVVRKVITRPDKFKHVAKKLHNHNTELHKNNDHLKRHNVHLKRDNELLNQQKSEYEKKISNLQQDLNMAHSELRISSQNFTTTLKSIEDKCKAINFVIGRVYSDKRGGSPNIRKQLKIHRDLYNTFSEMSSEFTSERSGALISILQKILYQLNMMEQKETSIIKTRTGRILIKRSPNDRILDIMKKNDKDPVADYHAEAKEICTKLIDFLKSEYK